MSLDKNSVEIGDVLKPLSVPCRDFLIELTKQILQCVDAGSEAVVATKRGKHGPLTERTPERHAGLPEEINEGHPRTLSVCNARQGLCPSL